MPSPAEILVICAVALGLVILVLGLVKLLYVPLAIAFEIRQGRRQERPTLLDEQPFVSVVIPGYDEEVVIGNCVRSVLAASYPRKEIILVDDGSSDGTARLMADFAAHHDEISFVSQANGGKGSALNAGYRVARGEVLIFADADSIFLSETIEHMLRGFDSPEVGAVCGDDRPVNLDRVLTRLLAYISHVGTGLVRRALGMLRCLPIVSGNSGAFRREALERTGLFDTGTVGEDLELTWRMHREGYQVRFAPRALVYAESPSSLRGLWKQRVRWARGLLQTTGKHRAMIGSPRYGTFGPYLLFNTLTMIVVPVLQILLLVLLIPLIAVGGASVPGSVWAWLAWLGVVVAFVLSVIAIALNREWSDLRHAWTLPLWPLYSVFVGLTMVVALWKEARDRPATWDKLERSGVVSRDSSEETIEQAPAPADDDRVGIPAQKGTTSTGDLFSDDFPVDALLVDERPEPARAERARRRADGPAPAAARPGRRRGGDAVGLRQDGGSRAG